MADIYRTRQGKREKVSPREVKSYIMRVEGWTTEQYNKEYDILRNRLRNFEAFQRASGIEVTPQSPAEILYKQAKAKKRYGSEYTESFDLQRIRAFPSTSTGRKGQMSTRAQARMASLYRKTTNARFAGLIEANPTAARIADTIDDPVKREQALIAFANEMHIRIGSSLKAQKTAAIPYGQAIGSDEGFNFPIEQYL